MAPKSKTATAGRGTAQGLAARVAKTAGTQSATPLTKQEEAILSIDKLKVQLKQRVKTTRSKIKKTFAKTKQGPKKKPYRGATLAEALLTLLEKKREAESEMADALHNLRKTYSSMFRDLESIVREEDGAMQDNVETTST